MMGGTIQSDGKGWQSPHEAHSRRVQNDLDDYHQTAALREVVARMAVPLSKTIGKWCGWGFSAH